MLRLPARAEDRYDKGVERIVAEGIRAGVFRDVPPDDPVARLERVDTALDEMIRDNEVALRLMLQHALERRVRHGDDTSLPMRQNRRTPLIEAALEPARRGGVLRLARGAGETPMARPWMRHRRADRYDPRTPRSAVCHRRRPLGRNA